MRILSWLFCLGLVGCVSRPALEPERPPIAPRQALLLVFNGLPAELPDSPQFPGFARLREQGILFHEASLGHLPAIAELSLLVLLTGKQPKSLPFQSGLLRTRQKRLLPLEHFLSPEDMEQFPNLSPAMPFGSGANPGKRYVLSTSPWANFASFLLASEDWELMPSERKLADETAPVVVFDKLTGLLDSAGWRLILCLLGTSSLTEADFILSRVFSQLDAAKKLDATLILVTSTAAVSPERKTAIRPRPLPDPIGRFEVSKHIEAIEWDNTLRVWLSRPSPDLIVKAAIEFRSFPQVAEIYAKQIVDRKAHYIRHYRDPKFSVTDLSWAASHHQGLVDSFAAPDGPDLVLLFTDNGESRLKSHSRVPLFLRSPNMRPGSFIADEPVIFADIAPIVARLLGEQPSPGRDGDSAFIERHLRR